MPNLVDLGNMNNFIFLLKKVFWRFSVCDTWEIALEDENVMFLFIVLFVL